MSHTIDVDERDGIVTCRILGALEDEAARRFGKDLLAAIEEVRARGGPLLYLVDNREGRVASPAAARALAERLAAAKRPGDRTAIVVPDSLGKLQAKRFTSSEHEVFLSENAARTWLTAYAASRAATCSGGIGDDIRTSPPPA